MFSGDCVEVAFDDDAAGEGLGSVEFVAVGVLAGRCVVRGEHLPESFASVLEAAQVAARGRLEEQVTAGRRRGSGHSGGRVGEEADDELGLCGGHLACRVGGEDVGFVVERDCERGDRPGTTGRGGTGGGEVVDDCPAGAAGVGAAARELADDAHAGDLASEHQGADVVQPAGQLAVGVLPESVGKRGVEEFTNGRDEVVCARRAVVAGGPLRLRGPRDLPGHRPPCRFPPSAASTVSAQIFVRKGVL